MKSYTQMPEAKEEDIIEKEQNIYWLALKSQTDDENKIDMWKLFSIRTVMEPYWMVVCLDNSPNSISASWLRFKILIAQ